MIEFLRGFFGLGGPTGNRTVVGRPSSFNIKQAAYIRDSNKRLVALEGLIEKYKHTPQFQKMKAVYEKTQHIHAFMVDRGRLHELELFHMQHTDHFLNTYSVIYHAHRHQPKVSTNAANNKNGSTRKVVSHSRSKESSEAKEIIRQNREISQKVFEDTASSKSQVPKLTAPLISINTYSKIIYLKEVAADDLNKREIGFTSSPAEKKDFETYVSERLGLDDLSYAGNAMVLFTHNNSAQAVDLVPVILWNGCPYALCLDGFIMYPVKTYRKSG